MPGPGLLGRLGHGPLGLRVRGIGGLLVKTPLRVKLFPPGGGRLGPHPALRKAATPHPTPATAPQTAPLRTHSLSRGRWTPCLFVWSPRARAESAPSRSAPRPHPPPPTLPRPAPPRLGSARADQSPPRKRATWSEERVSVGVVDEGTRDLCGASSRLFSSGKLEVLQRPLAHGGSLLLPTHCYGFLGFWGSE